jgi:hypothetical protein
MTIFANTSMFKIMRGLECIIYILIDDDEKLET